MTYRKWGRTVRWENGVVVRVEEAGEAWEENGVFYANPVILRRDDGEGCLDVGNVVAVAQGVLRFAQGDIGVERLIVTDGVAVHECDGVRWSEETHRLHVALTRRPWRVLVDDAAAVERVARALARCEGERDVAAVRLAPSLATALLPALPCAREQLAGGIDGAGRPIERRRVSGTPPNVYRPSYRVRPVPAWLNLRALPFGAFDASAPLAVARVDAPWPAALVEEGERAFVARLRTGRVLAVSEDGEIML